MSFCCCQLSVCIVSINVLCKFALITLLRSVTASIPIQPSSELADGEGLVCTGTVTPFLLAFVDFHSASRLVRSADVVSRHLPAFAPLSFCGPSLTGSGALILV